MPWLQFDFDDIHVGDESAVVVRGSRRFRVRGLTRLELVELARLRRGSAYAECRSLGETLQQKLRKLGLAHQVASAPNERGVTVTSPKALKRLAWVLAPLTSRFGLSVVCFATLALYSRVELHGATLSRPSTLVTLSLRDWLLGTVIFACSVVVHELGHIAACAARTGFVGHLRFRWIRGLPAVATDVSIVHGLPALEKVSVSLSGPVFQSFWAVSAVAVYPSAGVSFGAHMALMGAILNLIPIPGTDGHWIISDLCGRKLPAAIVPFPSALPDLAFATFHLVVSIALFLSIGRFAYLIAISGVTAMDGSFSRGALLCAIGLMSFVVCVRFGVSSAKRILGQ